MAQWRSGTVAQWCSGADAKLNDGACNFSMCCNEMGSIGESLAHLNFRRWVRSQAVGQLLPNPVARNPTVACNFKVFS